MNRSKILIVEDDAEIREFVSLYLSRHGYRTTAASDGRQALLQFERAKPDLVLLDVVLPDIQGLELCRMIRQRAGTPIIFLSCKWESDYIVKGLETGGDDYVTKPFVPQELLARIKSHLRRLRPYEETLVFDSLHINVANCEVKVDQSPVTLYAKELQLLIFMARNPNQVFSVEELYEKVWGDEKEGDHRTVMVHISNLRRKIEKDPASPRWIQTVRGFGYRLHP